MGNETSTNGHILLKIFWTYLIDYFSKDLVTLRHYLESFLTSWDNSSNELSFALLVVNLVVSVVAFYSDHPSLKPAEVNSFDYGKIAPK